MALSPRLKWPYPDQSADPWFDAFQAMVNAEDASAYAAREDRQILTTGGGTICFTASTGTVTWSAPIVIFAPITGFTWIIPTGSLNLQSGQYIYVNLVRAPASNINLTPLVANQIPSSDAAFAICVRAQSRVYFRNGTSLGDGSCSTVLTGGSSSVDVVPDPSRVVGNLETLVGSIYLRGSSITTGHAMVGSQAIGDTATLNVRRNADSSLVTSFGGPGFLTDRTVSNVSFVAGWHDLTLVSSNSTGTAICLGLSLQTT